MNKLQKTFQCCTNTFVMLHGSSKKQVTINKKLIVTYFVIKKTYKKN